MVYSYSVGELAIAIAYAMLDRDDPLGVAASMVRGYCERNSLDDNELASLFGLVLLRLCVSACIAADQQAQRPDNEYLSVSQRAIRRALPELAAIPFGVAEATFRAAAGLVASPAGVRVREYLASMPAVAPVLGFDLATEPLRRTRPERRESTRVGRLAREHRATIERARIRGDEARGSSRFGGPVRRAATVVCGARVRDRTAPDRRAPHDPHWSRSIRRRGHSGVRAAFRNDSRVQRQRAATGLRTGDHPSSRDRTMAPSSSPCTDI